jgi:hypothetical protein
VRNRSPIRAKGSSCSESLRSSTLSSSLAKSRYLLTCNWQRCLHLQSRLFHRIAFAFRGSVDRRVTEAQMLRRLKLAQFKPITEVRAGVYRLGLPEEVD